MIVLTDDQPGIFLNLMVGVVGATVGGWLLSPMVGLAAINPTEVNMGALLVAMVGAIVLLSVFNVFRSGRAR